MQTDKKIYLSLGSNLGDRAAHLEAAIGALNKAGIHVTAESSLYETEPQDVREQPWFLNLAVEAETTCFPVQLLAVVQRVERELGRVRTGAARRGPRVIDIDILLFEDVVMNHGSAHDSARAHGGAAIRVAAFAGRGAGVARSKDG